MQEDRIKQLLEQVRDGQVNVDAALADLRTLPFENVGDFAMLDHHRAMRQGFPEVVFGENKRPEQVVAIVRRLAERNDRVLVTRVTEAMYAAVQADLPEMTYYPIPRLLVLDHSKNVEKRPGILVATAGTADMPVAEEAAMTAELMGNVVDRMFDVGVAGIHRLLNQTGRLRSARVIVVAAGMDGALPSVVGGLVSVPVIAVPTSVGYGASFGGIAALLTMLNSCANGISVVNIDNGFGAGYIASVINQQGKDL
jgi:pyridinium-3,5-biscarboxylic acid mononucleotide synthase